MPGEASQSPCCKDAELFLFSGGTLSPASYLRTSRGKPTGSDREINLLRGQGEACRGPKKRKMLKKRGRWRQKNGRLPAQEQIFTASFSLK